MFDISVFNSEKRLFNRKKKCVELLLQNKFGKASVFAKKHKLGKDFIQKLNQMGDFLWESSCDMRDAGATESEIASMWNGEWSDRVRESMINQNK
jgi:hypothetical protein